MQITSKEMITKWKYPEISTNFSIYSTSDLMHIATNKETIYIDVKTYGFNKLGP